MRQANSMRQSQQHAASKQGPSKLGSHLSCLQLVGVNRQQFTCFSAQGQHKSSMMKLKSF